MNSVKSNNMTKRERFWKRLPYTTFFDPKFIGNSLDKKLIENVKKDDIEAVKKYLKLGANINSKDEMGKTSLMLALERENYFLAEFLINEGSKLHTKDKDGRTSLHHASMVGKDLKFVSLVLSEIPKEKQSKMINLQDKYGNTPLILSVKNGNYYVANHLVRCDANQYITNNFGESASTIAREKNYNKISEMLHKNK